MDHIYHLPWADMAWPLVTVALLFVAAVFIKVFLMAQDPVYRDRILYGRPKRK